MFKMVYAFCLSVWKLMRAYIISKMFFIIKENNKDTEIEQIVLDHKCLPQLLSSVLPQKKILLKFL